MQQSWVTVTTCLAKPLSDPYFLHRYITSITVISQVGLRVLLFPSCSLSLVGDTAPDFTAFSKMPTSNMQLKLQPSTRASQAAPERPCERHPVGSVSFCPETTRATLVMVGWWNPL